MSQFLINCWIVLSIYVQNFSLASNLKIQGAVPKYKELRHVDGVIFVLSLYSACR